MPRNSENCFELLLRQAQRTGHAELADRLDFVLHQECWTTSSELLGELGQALLAFQRGQPRMSSEVQFLVNRCLAEVRKTWPDLE